MRELRNKVPNINASDVTNLDPIVCLDRRLRAEEPEGRLNVKEIKSHPFFGESEEQREKFFKDIHQNVPDFYINGYLARSLEEGDFFLSLIRIHPILRLAEQLYSQSQVFTPTNMLNHPELLKVDPFSSMQVFHAKSKQLLDEIEKVLKIYSGESGREIKIREKLIVLKEAISACPINKIYELLSKVSATLNAFLKKSGFLFFKAKESISIVEFEHRLFQFIQTIDPKMASLDDFHLNLRDFLSKDIFHQKNSIFKECLNQQEELNGNKFVFRPRKIRAQIFEKGNFMVIQDDQANN